MMSGEGRVFAIGDVHGCLAELEALLDLIRPTHRDRLVFLGDLVNRGPDSPGVLRRVRKLRNTRCLMGNHEQRLLHYRKHRDATVLKDYDRETIAGMCSEDWDFLENLDLILEIPREHTIFVHAGLLPWLPWREQLAEIVCHIQVIEPGTRKWGKRTEFPQGASWQNFWEGPPFVITGHTPRTEVFRRPWSLCLDTGCVYGNKLTACEIHSLELIQVQALENYAGKPLREG